jgi:hypothetical protein
LPRCLTQAAADAQLEKSAAALRNGWKRVGFPLEGGDLSRPDEVSEYLTGRGTSAAAPHVAGMLALYLQKYPGRRADEIKAGLINSAVDLNRKDDQTTYPQGWGRATAYDFLYETVGESLDGYFRGEVGDLAPHAMQQSLSFPVPNGARYAKVTMTYLDRPAAMNAAPTLVNDLDLRLRSPSGVAFTYPGRRVDNVEQVMVIDPEPGTLPGPSRSTFKPFRVSPRPARSLAATSRWSPVRLP